MCDSGWRASSSREPAATSRPPRVAPFGPQVNEAIRGLDDLQVVFDDDDGVAVLHQTVQHLEQLFDIRQVESGGGLIQDVEGAAGGPFAQLPGRV